MSLTEFLASYRPQPFDWHLANCCHFAAAWVEARTGVNPMQGLESTPDRRAAVALVRRLGGSLRAAWTAQLGREPIPATFAQEGDVVLLTEHNAVAVCAGPVAIYVESGGSATFMPMKAAECAWRIEP